MLASCSAWGAALHVLEVQPSASIQHYCRQTLCRSDQVDDAGIVLSLESRSSEALAAACERLKSLLPMGVLLSEHRDSSAINTPTASPAPAAKGGLAPAST